MPHLGLPELIIILIIALFIFGPNRLKEIGSSLGKGIRAFKKEMEEDESKHNDKP